MSAQSSFKRFDFNKKPLRQWQILRPLTWLICFPSVWKNKTKIVKVNMQGLKPPYILLCNHNSFYDFKVATVAIFPNRANYIVAIDGFIGREWLLRKVGCLGKRKFTNDTSVIKNNKRVLDNGDILVIYPEARYSLCGTNAVLPESLGKMIKLFKVPVVTLITKGNHLKSPVWNLKYRKNPTQAVLKHLITKEDINEFTSEKINEIINNEFIYDDYIWQKENRIKISSPDRAEGLHKVLYQCPNCKAEYLMNSNASIIWCEACGKQWEMSVYGELKASEGETEFSHIPDWYEWEREQVREQVRKGKYEIKLKVRVDSLPNAKGYINLGNGELIHNSKGFVLKGKYQGEYYQLEKNVMSMYSCHIEYDYLGKFGDCIDLSTLIDTYYIYPKGKDFSVTKISLATEELYIFEKEKSLYK